MAVTSPLLSVSLKDDVPEIESTTRVDDSWAGIKIGEYEWNQRIVKTDPNFFDFFGIHVITKKSQQPLDDVTSVMITQRLANEYFGSPEEAIGKNVEIREGNGYVDYAVCGVFEDIKENFHLTVEIVLSVHVDKKFDTRTSEFISTFVKTNESILDKEAFDIKLTRSHYMNQYDVREAAGLTTFDEFKAIDDNAYLFIISEPLTDIHFSKHKFDNAITSNKTYVYGAILLALLVIIISFVNYLNLSLATLSKRFKNFGIRKTIGASKYDIARSFFGETLISFLVIISVSYLIFILMEKPFTQFTNFNISMKGEHIGYLGGVFAILLLLLVSFSNFISYLVVSRQSSQGLIKKTDQNNLSQFAGSRNFFLILQFTIAIFIVVATLLVNKQIRYFASSDKGFESENILTFNLDYKYYSKFKPFVEELKESPLIRSVGTSNNMLGNDFDMGASYFNSVSDENYFHASYLSVDDGFAEVYDLELMEGRFFDEHLSSDPNEVVINESTAKEYMLDNNVLDDFVIHNGNSSLRLKIIGIVKDFNYRTLHHPIEPLVIRRSPVSNNISVKISQDQAEESIDFIRSMFVAFEMGRNFSYSFMDDNLSRKYQDEARFRRLLTFITTLAIFISCLGLFAISQISVLNKRKEIAIRKINGAKVVEVLAMLNKSYVRFVLVAVLLASGISWYAMNRWLENFAYKTELSWWVFALAGLIALSVALLTVSWQSWKAATRNPVEALRYE